MDAHPLYTDVLEAGDRLADALAAGDLGAASAALDDRARLVGVIDAAALPPPPPALADRLRDQQERVRAALRTQSAALTDAIGATGRAVAARRQYASGPRRSVMDTAPR